MMEDERLICIHVPIYRSIFDGSIYLSIDGSMDGWIDLSIARARTHTHTHTQVLVGRAALFDATAMVACFVGILAGMHAYVGRIYGL